MQPSWSAVNANRRTRSSKAAAASEPGVTNNSNRVAATDDATAAAKAATVGADSNAASAENDDADEDDTLRCICGEMQEDQEKRAYVQCDACDVWQHQDCMDVLGRVPEHYYCEECRREDHVGLLDAVRRGERPWVGRRTVLGSEDGDGDEGEGEDGDVVLPKSVHGDGDVDMRGETDAVRETRSSFKGARPKVQLPIDPGNGKQFLWK
ncbi:Transcription factor bye1 [Elasticomyces elasticus]|nr:Transcription factor bye1 [Elasticomyces elasticus]